MAKRRISKKTKNFIQSLVFFTSTFAIITCLILYLWVYTEIDETILAIEIQSSTAEELQNTIHKLKSEIESLSRADVIAKKAPVKLSFGIIKKYRIKKNIIIKIAR